VAHNVTSPLRRKVIEAFQRYRTPLNMAIELPTIEAIKRFVAMATVWPWFPPDGGARAGGRRFGQNSRRRAGDAPVLRLVQRRQATLSYAGNAFLQTLKELARKQGPPFIFRWNGPTESALWPFSAPPGATLLRLASIAMEQIHFPLPNGFRRNPLRAFTMLRAGHGSNRCAGPAPEDRQARCQPDEVCSREVQDRMKKIALIAFLLAVSVAAGRAQEAVKTSALVERVLLSRSWPRPPQFR